MYNLAKPPAKSNKSARTVQKDKYIHACSPCKSVHTIKKPIKPHILHIVIFSRQHFHEMDSLKNLNIDKENQDHILMLFIAAIERNVDKFKSQEKPVLKGQFASQRKWARRAKH